MCYTIHMNTRRFFIGRTIVCIILILIFGVYFIYKKTTVKPLVSITNFEECVSAGNAIMESYPRQCISKDKKHFVENIGNALEKNDLIQLEKPLPNSMVSSPLTLVGKARGTWYFEGSFPVVLTDWDGKIIASGIATAQSEWMTTEFVPFTATLTFNTKDTSGQYSNKGTLILKKDNPSGLAEHDDALEIPVKIQ